MRASKRFVKGLIYFPIYTDIINSESIRILRSDHGNDGFSCLIFLWCHIYGNDYYKNFGVREKKLFCDLLHFNLEDIDNILSTCFKEGIFNEDLYKKYNILTSYSIQDIWIEVTYRRTKLTMIKEFMLITAEDIPNSKRLEMVDMTGKLLKSATVNPPKSAQKPAAKQKSDEPNDGPAIRQFTYKDVNDYISVKYEDRDAVFKETYTKEEYNNYVSLNIKINSRYDGVRTSNRQLTFPEFIEFTEQSSPKPTMLELESAYKKMAELGVKKDVDIYLRLEACLNMIRTPFIKPPLSTPSITANIFRDAEIEQNVFKFWGLSNEKLHINQQMLFGNFLYVINNNGELDNFKEHFKYYKEYKTLAGLDFKHSFENFIGKQSERFANGIWKMDWKLKLTEEQKKKKSISNGRAKSRSGDPPERWGKI